MLIVAALDVWSNTFLHAALQEFPSRFVYLVDALELAVMKTLEHFGALKVLSALVIVAILPWLYISGLDDTAYGATRSSG